MRVVTFDAAGTLIRLVRPPGVIYAEVAQLFGFRAWTLIGVQESAFRKHTWGTFAPPTEFAGPVPDDDRGVVAWPGSCQDHGISGLPDRAV